MKQRETFLDSEGDAWYERNRSKLGAGDPDGDAVIGALAGCFEGPEPRPGRVLEVGCADGWRLAVVRDRWACEVAGVEPSGAAVRAARERGIDAVVGTADRLPFDDGSFDIVVLGFCLYLCDRSDLFRIAAETDRVLRAPGWLVVHDFYARAPTDVAYHHREGVRTYKMDCRAPFIWHPHYVCCEHRVHRPDGGFTDREDEWVGTSVLRKRKP